VTKQTFRLNDGRSSILPPASQKSKCFDEMDIQLREHEFRQFERRVWKEVERNWRRGIRFEPYGVTAKSAASEDESSPSAPSSVNS
jgi:hypothetical protein